MSRTSYSRTNEVSESDSGTSDDRTRHCYNTRSSRQPCNEPWTARRVNRSKKQRVTTEEDPCVEESYPMDYCFDPVPPAQPPSQQKTTSLCRFLVGSFVIVVLLGLAGLLYSQYSVYEDVKRIQEDLQKIKGVHKKEDPQAKLIKDLDKKCSDTLKLLFKDSVARPDFALQSSGGRVVSVDKSTYSDSKSFFGFNLCEGQHGPSSMIQATTAPGECWAFTGSTAKAVIQLIDEVMIDSVSLEHIPATISPSGTIDTAPKDFKIWGLDELRNAKRPLGQFTYESNGRTTQTFDVKNDIYYRYIEFEILSNHGNADFTCVYRIQVHGKPKQFT